LEPDIEPLTILTNRGIIWGFDFLPDSSIIFTEKTGKISLFKNKVVTELIGLPTNINADGQGGLLDVCLHPDYKNTGWVYATYSSLIANKGQLNLIRFKIKDKTLNNLENLFSTSPTNQWKGHYGSRILFDNKGFLYLSIGEGGTTSYGGATSGNLNAQNTKEAWGKVHRLTDDGKIPTDNPILPSNTVANSVFSYGHRNPQGLAFNTLTNELWETEHGPKGGDELNKIIKGNNYGWPMVSHGVNYDGKIVSESPFKDGVESPIFAYLPSIGTCGLAYISSNKYGAWQGDFLVGGLALQYLSRIDISNIKDIKETKILDKIGRVRNVKQASDGYIYISVENPGRIIKLIPKF
jgi:aldose sugar dehydrogenase